MKNSKFFLKNWGKITTDNFFQKYLEGGNMTKGKNDRGYYGICIK